MNFGAHVSLLARQHGVQVQKILGLGDGAVAITARRLIKIGELATPEAYYTALHELGHIILRHRAKRGDKAYTQRTEQEAWVWAFSNAKIAATASVIAEVKRCLAAYGPR